MAAMFKRSLAGFALGAIMFALVGVYLNREIGAPFLSNPGPVGIFAVIGGTIGGLIAPLFRRRVKRG
jgi:membrane associated rhomboid family serine protease